MTVLRIYSGKRDYRISGIGYEPRENTVYAAKKETMPAPKPAAEKGIITEEAEAGFFDLLTEEKLREGAVFSLILGPPKAYQFPGFYSRIHPHR